MLIITAIFATFAFGWDDSGHKITAYIAWENMRPEVRERVMQILKAAPEDSSITAFFPSYFSVYSTQSEAARKRDVFMLMATWPDVVRNKELKTRFEKYHHANWHYSDTFWHFEKGKAVLDESEEEGGLALQKIIEFDKLIRSSDATDADKAIAIVWLEHLIGDIHQPLHTSAKTTSTNKKGDQGGNLFYLTPKGTPKDQQDNLHWYWDGIIVRYEPNTKDVCEADYLIPIAKRIMAEFPYDKEKGKLNAGNFDEWRKEGLEIAMTEVYNGLDYGKTPPESYKKKAFEISEKRMALAGYRMAEEFNSAFASK